MDGNTAKMSKQLRLTTMTNVGKKKEVGKPKINNNDATTSQVKKKQTQADATK